MTTERGFTLIEVLVALTVLAITLGALIKVGGESGVLLSQLRGNTAAMAMAEDMTSRLHLSGEVPDLGRHGDTVDVAGSEWQVTRIVEESRFDGVRRVTFVVAAEPPAEGHARLSTFVYAAGNGGSDPEGLR